MVEIHHLGPSASSRLGWMELVSDHIQTCCTNRSCVMKCCDLAYDRAVMGSLSSVESGVQHFIPTFPDHTSKIIKVGRVLESIRQCAIILSV